MNAFRVRLERSYWDKGFFNVPVDFQRYFTTSDGPLTIFLADSAEPSPGKISRTANRNASPRIYGSRPLIDFFHARFECGESIDVEIISETEIRIRASSSLIGSST